MKKCELCHSAAKLFCESDQASLCWECDAKVHSANFLVTKHSRILLCHVCQSPTAWHGSGPKFVATMSLCNDCVYNNNDVINQHNHDDHDDDDGDGDGDDDDDDDSTGDNTESDEVGGGDDDIDEEENQVVPWTWTPPPPVSSSSNSSSSYTRFSNGEEGVSD